MSIYKNAIDSILMGLDDYKVALGGDERRYISSTRNLFAGNITRHPCFQSLTEGEDYRVASDLSNTDRIMNQSFWIGVYPGMTDEMLDEMADQIHQGLRIN